MSPSFTRVAVSLLAFGVVVAAGAPADAAPPAPVVAAPEAPTPAARAAALKEQGNQGMLDMRYVDALAAYEESLSLAPGDTTLLYSIGRARELLGDFPEALTAIERFAAEAPANVKARVGKLDELLAQLRARVSTLTIKCNVEGARILVRHKVVGATPLKAPARLIAGAATVDVELDGFFPQSREVVLPGAGSLAIEITLAPKSTSGMLVLKTDPPGARVSVDGHAEGTTTPSVELALPAGSHRLLAQREGYDDADSPVVLAPGASRELTLTLQRSVPVTRRWWFWTGVGAVVAGGAAFTAAMLIEKPAKQGTLKPGQVGAPLGLRFTWTFGDGGRQR
jgi:hypothetical protein